VARIVLLVEASAGESFQSTARKAMELLIVDPHQEVRVCFNDTIVSVNRDSTVNSLTMDWVNKRTDVKHD